MNTAATPSLRAPSHLVPKIRWFPRSSGSEAAVPRLWNRVALPPPAIRKIANLAWLCRVEKLESVEEHCELLYQVKWFTERMTERPPEEQRPRRSHFFGNIAEEGDRYRWNSRRFDGPLNQSDGLIAKPSSRSQKYKIWSFLSQTGDQLRKNFLIESVQVRSRDVPHERIMPGC